MPDLHIYPGIHELTGALCADFYQYINRLRLKKKLIHLALSGGNTPGVFFDRIADEPCDSGTFWNTIHLYWVDERCVSPDHPESNFGMTRKRLLQRIPIPAGNVHPIQGGNDPDFECIRYANEIKRNVPFKKELPVFDWIFLGIGDDGHTASIFPGNTSLLDSGLICASAIHPVSGQHRITLTGKVINQATRITFVVTGESKSTVVTHILRKEPESEKYPASFIRPVHGKLDWYLDEPAAKQFKTHGP